MGILRAASYRRMPWKNGGGETTEVAIWPENAGLDDFGWRVSMARVECDGPFSAFPGVDRTLSILDGEGLRLEIAGRPVVSLDGAAAPYSFPADQPTDSTLIGGPVTDLNVMTRRGTFTHAVRRLESTKAELESNADVTILFCHSGSATVMAENKLEELGPLDCMLPERLLGTVRIEAERPATFYVIDIMKPANF